MEDTSFNMDQLPAHLPDLPPCPTCGCAWVSLLSMSCSTGHEACACVVCVGDHEAWFGWGVEPIGWVHLNYAVPNDEVSSLLSQFPTYVSLARGFTRGGSDDPEGPPPDEVVAVFQFSEKGFGFGEIALIQTKEGCFIDTEHMSRETVKRFLGMLIDGAVTDTDTEPEKHLLYNRVAGRRCGGQCEICYPPESGT